MTCDSCLPGHRLDPISSDCEACEAQNCATCCADLSRCDSCPDGFDLDADAGTCTKASCEATNCAECSVDCTTKCVRCEDGYHLADGRCKACDVQNCDSCDRESSSCERCKANHGWDAAAQACVPCTSSTACLSCSEDVAKCDSCPFGFKLNWYEGTCDACMSNNCKTCNENLAKCDSCYAGFEGDPVTGHCWASQPMPLNGHCEGLTSPYELVTSGSCGAKIHWFGCDTIKVGAHGCYNAVMAEPKCSKDYFTYNERGDQNCGCRISNEEDVVIHEYDLSDCYRITNASLPGTTATPETVTTTPCDTTEALLQEEDETNSNGYLWTAAGVDAVHASNEFDAFHSPEAGSIVTGDQLAEIHEDALSTDDMLEFGWWSWAKSMFRN